ncbi:hypothetical protein AAFF_G00085490 [Aldrovandia affinis]|uniref:Uncharacterized protein n=1 Tax=Aldrovandia affinis TaxID=143900 RepID=A0AAD7RWY6_9TELE|nr:hypothetical protein AAFF_G00085490 [Aldrovandia affinis]
MDRGDGECQPFDEDGDKMSHWPAADIVKLHLLRSLGDERILQREDCASAPERRSARYHGSETVLGHTAAETAQRLTRPHSSGARRV